MTRSVDVTGLPDEAIAAVEHLVSVLKKQSARESGVPTRTEGSLSRPVRQEEVTDKGEGARVRDNGSADHTDQLVADFLEPIEYGWTEAGFEARQALKRYSEETHADH